MTDIALFSFRKEFDSCLEELEIDAGDYEYRMNKKKQNQTKKNTEEAKEAEIVIKNTKPTAIQILTHKINNYQRNCVAEITKKYGKYCWGLYYGKHTRSPATIVAYRNDKYSIPDWDKIKTMTASIDKTFKNKNEFIEWIKKESYLHRNNLN